MSKTATSTVPSALPPICMRVHATMLMRATELASPAALCVDRHVLPCTTCTSVHVVVHTTACSATPQCGRALFFVTQCAGVRSHFVITLAEARPWWCPVPDRLNSPQAPALASGKWTQETLLCLDPHHTNDREDPRPCHCVTPPRYHPRPHRASSLQRSGSMDPGLRQLRVP